MVTLNFKDGRIEKFNLKDDTSREKFNSLGQCFSTKGSEVVTGIWFNTENHGITLPSPKRFRRVSFFGEIVYKNGEPKGERITVHADQVRMSITSWYRENGKMAKVELFKIGKQIFNP